MTDPTADLASLLSREREALLAGNYDALAVFAHEKEALIATFEANGGLPMSALEALRTNMRLIAAARAGYQSGRARISELAQVQTGFTSYDSQGVSSNRMSNRSGMSKSI